MMVTLEQLVAAFFNGCDSRLTDAELDEAVAAFQASERLDNGIDPPRWTDEEVRQAMLDQLEHQFG